MHTSYHSHFNIVTFALSGAASCALLSSDEESSSALLSPNNSRSIWRALDFNQRAFMGVINYLSCAARSIIDIRDTVLVIVSITLQFLSLLQLLYLKFALK